MNGPHARPIVRLIAVFAIAAPAVAQVPPTPEARPYEPDVRAASDEGQQAIARFRVPTGLAVDLFAAEPLLANPVAFTIDPHGRVYVCETFRHSAGVTDTRGHMSWLDDDLASRSVADRVAKYRKHLGPEEFARYAIEHDRIRLVEDRDGDGVAETATVFADGFNRHETGIGAGVLAVGRDVYYTCIPDLWRLRDTDGDGVADERQALHTGYGVHTGFIGHDLHGLILGPDGRLYFTIGDRGLNVTTIDGRHVLLPDCGAVLRCELDGSNLEIVHMGLRNPQELAFDEWGNLFTVDNNSDGGDRARLVWVVPGGDSGWRIGYQFLDEPNPRGPWNAERMWRPQTDDQPAFLVPALANFSDGPSGLAYNPGTALGPRQRGRFFLADFRGSADNSGVRSFAVRPKGAAFELVDQDQFLWGLEATDVAFGPDGALYVSDWVEGWNKTGKGRIYRVADPATADEPLQRDVRRLLDEGMAERPVEELLRLLDHADLRVRLAAQFELAARPDAEDPIEAVALRGPSLIARVHALWAIGQRLKEREALLHAFLDEGDTLSRLRADRDPEIRAQIARLIAEARSVARPSGDFPSNEARYAAALVPLLKDESPRVRFFAALALGRVGHEGAVPAILDMLRENADQDAYLRHAGVMALVGIANADTWLKAADDPAPSVRLAVLLALRRLGSPEVARFLADAEPRIVVEAARSVFNAPIEPAMAALAGVAVGPETPAPLARRVIWANVRHGAAETPGRLARLAALEGLSTTLRAEALTALAAWPKPPGRDAITGLWRPLPERPAGPAAEALAVVVGPLLGEAPNAVRVAAAKAAATLRVGAAIPALTALLNDRERSSATRIAALEALDALEAPGLAELVEQAVGDPAPAVRAAGLPILARIDPARALPVLARMLDVGSTIERQRAFATLADLRGAEAAGLLVTWLNRLIAGQVPDEVQLDLLEAAGRVEAPEVRRRLAEYEAALPADDPLAPYRVALAGGDARRGGRIFFTKEDTSCLRCHKIRGNGGEVGPELTGIGSKQDRTYLLESIVLPNKHIAEGFETRVLALDDGQILSGIVRREDERTLTLITAEGQTIEVETARIEEQRRGESAMPADLVQKLTRAELRDLIEFLATSR